MPMVDTQVSPSSSSEDLPTSTSTSPSSVEVELHKNINETAQSDIHLPAPFFPPSLAQKDPRYDLPSVIPRQLPSHLGFPSLPTEKACSNVDPADIGTPDAWIPRDSRLVRLTGKHPFNSEARLRDLYEEGFITPSNLFFVRNHGAVPKVDQKTADSWELKIHGLCANPVTLTLADLRTKFRVVTVPITLVCAGNRRKEQNVVQKSLGFSWGAGGLSTALFTGVYLADVLAYVQPERSAKHVVFEGIDDLPNGPYGTSQLLSWARDPRKGMMLAWGMNGLALEPDHGFPLRLVVPSQIGGRSVKWLSRIELSPIESQHHLHFHDNKVLPMPLGPDQARKEKEWWYDPRYIIRELNVNSAVACPDHDEVLDTTSASPTYTVKGYAYAGGGRRVARVELSSDNGDTWDLASITYPEDAFRSASYTSDSVYGDLDLTDSDISFCWCFWSYDIPVERLKGSNAIMVRGMDESLALQPRDMYWNATGMMNNWWFRVCIHHLEGGKLRFEHPTMAGTQPGGWMQRLKDDGLDPSKPDFSLKSTGSAKTNVSVAASSEVVMTNPSIMRKISAAELDSMEAKEEAWFVVRGEVGVDHPCVSPEEVDLKIFTVDHPGGAQSIELVAGEDATEDFIAIHSSDARRQLAEFHIGTFQPGDTMQKQHVAADDNDDDDQTKPFLRIKRWKPVELVNIRDVSKNAKVFRFALREKTQELGLPFGQHVYVRLKRKVKVVDGVQSEWVQRAYTPLSERNATGFVDLLVKIYYPNPEFPEGGRMSLGFAELVVGDRVELKGPVGHFIWKGNGVASLHDHDRHIEEIGLVCGGSGVTPILQVLRAILSDSSSTTKVWVLDVNREFEDILCKEEIDRLARENENRVKLHYSLTGREVPDNWDYSRGRITDEMLAAHMPIPGEDKLVCICGPSAMEQKVKASLRSIGWDELTAVVLF
ncbi:nitrate reductase [Pholiota conissans]|uniref:Nitrate reductase [NADPH] n=1 Tax=Pholiota conissans TaxID=109636 RepID=A0A9P6CVD9_9AGAR|nr:nitrate reductase [Pholiota conissans]